MQDFDPVNAAAQMKHPWRGGTRLLSRRRVAQLKQLKFCQVSISWPLPPA